ncbi:hypothetical protein, partial [Vibrio penaeicida]|uniref:hypothetical protein n=1 Tax=Vibrio penaeicida TaxID=104609 RepID=UPI001C8C3C20
VTLCIYPSDLKVQDSELYPLFRFKPLYFKLRSALEYDTITTLLSQTVTHRIHPLFIIHT